jgi:hypothetical protein
VLGSPHGRYCGDARATRAPVTVGETSLIKGLLVCGLVTSALAWCGTPALADATPAPPPTTTTADAPPPDPYKPQVRASTKPKTVTPAARPAPVVHSAPTTVQHYVPAVTTTPRAAPATPVHHVRTKARHKKSVPVRHHPKKRAAVNLGLAPVAQLLAAAEAPVRSSKASDGELLRLAGVAFAVLAAASLSLVGLSRRADRVVS